MQISTTDVFAITATPSATVAPTKSDSSVSDQINDLKDKIASRVAQLKLVEKRGVIGTTTKVSDTQLTISDLQNNNRLIDIDELTKFASPSAKESFGISDITSGMKLGILGIYNKQSRRILARFVEVVVTPTLVQGAVTEINDEDFLLTVTTDSNSEVVVSVESSTKTSSYTSEGGLVKSGFSKIALGERISVVGYFDRKEKDQVNASRIILFPELAVNPKIKLPSNLLATPPQASASAKITPTKAASGSATKTTQ